MIKSVKSKFRQRGRLVVAFLKRHWNEPAKPVLVYQMGKVASSSIYSSLKRTKAIDAFHVHRLNPENISLVREEHVRRGDSPPNEQEGIYLYEKVIRPRKKPVKIISLVREPVGRNISAFFQNLQSFEGMANAHSFVDTNQLIENFLQRYNHDVPLTWFDIELHATTGIDIYQHSFPHQQGYCVIKAYPYDLLIIRHDLDDRQKEKCIAKFLGIDSFYISRANEAMTKEYADAYRKFIDAIKVPTEYVDRMLSSKYAQHFYSQEERQAIYRKWTKIK
jgi:hypothetical protein